MAKKDYVRYINSLLNENTEQSKQELSDLFADEEFRENDMLEDTRMGYMHEFYFESADGVYVYSNMYIPGRKSCTY